MTEQQHPLTDDMIEDIAYETIQSDETVTTGGLGVPRYHDGRVMLRYADMRAAYDLGESKGRADTLEQVIEWLNDNVGMLLLYTESESSERYLDSLEKEFIQDFKNAMRPQQQEDN